MGVDEDVATSIDAGGELCIVVVVDEKESDESATVDKKSLSITVSDFKR